MRVRALSRIALALTLALTATCGGADRVTGLSENRPSQDPALLGLFRHRLIYCPSATTSTVTQTVGLLGGTLSVAGIMVSIPPGALLGDTPLTLTVPASQYMEIDVSVPGTTSFLFQQPITATINYSRCTGLIARFLPLTAWHINTATKALLEPMVSVDNKLLRSVTFTTIHLSGYALAN
jgi:hypothetical protein